MEMRKKRDKSANEIETKLNSKWILEIEIWKPDSLLARII